MDHVQKTLVRLSHWIEHNLDHLKGYDDAARSLETEGLADAAHRVRTGISLIQRANDEFQNAIAAIHTHGYGPGHGHEESDHHEHPHDHGGSKDHDHGHHHHHED